MKLDVTHARVSAEELAETMDTLEEYRAHLETVSQNADYSADEASLCLPSDTDLRETVEEVYERVASSSLKYIFLIGIGGSNLGTKAVYDALYGFFDVLHETRRPKIIFLDTNDGAFLAGALELIDTLESPEDILVNIITKSGGTTETVLNGEIVLDRLFEKFGDAAKKRVVVTSGKDSVLTKSAKKHGFEHLSIEQKVGGRFSVLSAVGLLPLRLVGIDIDELLSGALDMRTRALIDSSTENYALQSAAVLHISRSKGKVINTNFAFHPELESLLKWYRQLMGESIGKLEDAEGNVVRSGITPDVSVGSTDLHSVAQLYLGGPQDKITTFVSATTPQRTVATPTKRRFSDSVPMITGKDTRSVMHAIFEGTKTAYDKNESPFMEVTLEDISPYEIGQFLQFKMAEMMYLGKLFNVNTFNQPSVEDYKVETKRILENN